MDNIRLVNEHIKNPKKGSLDLQIKKETRLYNILFPLWGVYLMPIWWAIILPANFIMDSLIFIVALVIFGIPGKKEKYKKCILRIWGYGFLSDIIGAAFLFVLLAFNYIDMKNAFNPLGNPTAFAFTSVGVILAGICIYYFNYNKVLILLDLEDNKRKRIAMIIAVLTTPYTMYLPSEFFF